MKKALVTGCAGFVGSNMVDLLLSTYPDLEVVGIDNLTTGSYDNIRGASATQRFQFFEEELYDLDYAYTADAFAAVDTVFHFAANADIRNGPKETSRDIEQNIMVTYRVLEAMRKYGCKTIVFTSTGPVYGENRVVPTPEDAPMAIQTSLYATSKLAAEGLISSYCEAFGIESYIFRMVSLMGPRYSHGHVIDFVRQLQDHPDRLDVLGDGTAKKSYLHVHDAIRAMIHVYERNMAASQFHKTAIYNLGLTEYMEILDSAKLIATTMGLSPEIVTKGPGPRGWVGDVPTVILDTTKILSTGWKPEYSIQEAVVDTVNYLTKQP